MISLLCFLLHLAIRLQSLTQTCKVLHECDPAYLSRLIAWLLPFAHLLFQLHWLLLVT